MSLNKFTISTILPLTLLLITGCGPTMRTVHYGVANSGSTSKYLTKPLYEEDAENNKAATYVSGQYFTNFGEGYYSDELSRFGDFLIHRVHSEKHHNISYGILGYMGKYHVNELTDFKGDKSFYGGGVTGGFNVRLPIRRVEWRIIGLQSTLLYEDGKYASFRKEAEDAEALVAGDDGEEQVLFNDLHPDNLVANVSVNTELIIKLDKISLGFYGSAGSNWGINGAKHYVLTGSLNVLLNNTNTTFFIQGNTLTHIGYYSIGISQRLF